MYLPEAFAERDPSRLARFMAEFPLGLLVTPRRPGSAAPQDGNPGLDVDANLLPFEYQRPEGGPAAGVLLAHVARANPLWQHCDGAAVLVTFQGPHAYVSPGWYPGKREHGKVVPTWNYTMVQARGTLHVRDDVDWLRAQVTRLTARHEAPFAPPWLPDDAPAGFVDALLRAVVGIEIHLHSLAGKWKLSQNRTPADQRGVAEAMRTRARGDDASPFAWLARTMDGALKARGSEAGADAGAAARPEAARNAGGDADA